MSLGQEKPLRNAKYLKWLREKPCMTCGRTPSTAAHIGTSNFRKKPPDDQAVPLCSEHHYIQEYHKDKYQKLTGMQLPTLEDCEFYYRTFSEEQASRQ